MSRLLVPILATALALWPFRSAAAEGPAAPARVDTAASLIRDDDDALALTFALSRAAPWRAFTLTDPPRLVIEVRAEAMRGGEAGTMLRPGRATALRAESLDSGWSRMVVDLAQPLVIDVAGMATEASGGGGVLEIRLAPATAEKMRAASAAPASGAMAPTVDAVPQGQGPLTVVLDPGHGGIDPGAEADGLSEADLMLAFAGALRDAFLSRPGIRVVMTREADAFVALDTRVRLAREAGADLFLSLHADAVAEGRASGATVYTLSATASDEASQALAERHDRADLLAGVDLRGQDDVLAEVLMDIARLDTQPRSEALADALVAGLAESVGGLHKRPRLAAGFSVLRTPDIPSALVELGFISSASDRDRLESREWRRRAAEGIADAVLRWAEEDAARAALLRR